MSNSSTVSPFALTGADVPYDNAASGLDATNLQAAVDEVASGGGGGGEIVMQTYPLELADGMTVYGTGAAYLYRRGRERWIRGAVRPGAPHDVAPGPYVLAELGVGDSPENLGFVDDYVTMVSLSDADNDIPYRVSIIGRNVHLYLPEGKPTTLALSIEFNGVWLTQ